VEVTGNLLSPGWTTTGVERVGTGSINADFNRVTHRINMAGHDERFVRLQVR
jgi:hypothetical protein